MKFATKLTILVSGALIFFAAVVSYVVYKSNIETLENQIKCRQIDTAVHIMDKIDRMLFERFADIKTIASDPIVSSRNSTPRQIRERLSEFRNFYKTYISLSLFDLNRVRISDTSGLDIGEQHPLEGYWEDVLENKDFIMDVSESVSLKRTVIHFAFPVKDKSRETFGVVVTRIPIERLYYIIKEAGNLQEEELQIGLIDKDGLLIYSNYNRKGILEDSLADLEGEERLLAGEKTGTGRFFHEGIEHIYVFVYEQGYMDFKGNGWSLIIHTPAKVIFAPAVKLRNRMLFILLVVLFFSVFIVLFLSRAITRPITKLARGTNIIGKGNLEYRVEVKTRDELGKLAVSFNQMVEKLKKSNSALRKSEERFHAIFEQAAVGVAQILTKTGQFVRINKRYCNIVGYTQEEMTLITFMKITHPDDLQADLDNMQKLIEGKIREFSMEKRYYRKDGSIVWVNLTVSPMWSAGEQPDYHIAVVEDITERKQAEDELLKKSSYCKLLGTVAISANEAVDIEDAFLPVLEEICSYTGWEIGHAYVLSKEDPNLLEPTDVWWLEDKRRFKDFCSVTKETKFARGIGLPGRVLESGKPHWIVDVTRDKNLLRTEITRAMNIKSGIAFPVMVRSKVVGVLTFFTTEEVQPNQQFMKIMSDVGTQLGRTVERKQAEEELKILNQSLEQRVVERTAELSKTNKKLLIEINERKQAEKAMRESEERYRKLIETANDAIFIADVETGIILDVNKRAEELMNMPAEKIVGMHQKQLHPQDEAETYKKIFSDHVQRGKGISEDVFVCRKDGYKVPVEISASVIECNGKKVIQGIFRDITERKKAEEILQEQKKALEQKNMALGEVLGQIEIEKKQIKDNVIANAENLLLPIIQKLRLKGESRKYVQLLRKNLQELTSSFGTRLTEREDKLTSREIEICNMIKNGLTSKEIASLLNTSLLTIEKHRANIRRKTGIINKDINLSSFLKRL